METKQPQTETKNTEDALPSRSKRKFIRLPRTPKAILVFGAVLSALIIGGSLAYYYFILQSADNRPIVTDQPEAQAGETIEILSEPPPDVKHEEERPAATG